MQKISNRIPVIVIFAPTACGKTALAKDIFGKSSLTVFKDKGEVVSADSQAVYKYFDIGTAKPTEQENLEIPHHLINIVEPETQFGVGEFVPLADKCCSEIYSRGKIPVVLGGTGFYIRNFVLGLTKAPESNEVLREELKKRMEKEGKEVLYKELQSVDPDYALKININDEYRIIRALEVYYNSGRPLSSYKMPDSLRTEYDFLILILNRQREDLYNRINLRVENMFQDGLVEEIEKLKSLGYNENTPAMKAIGYKEFFSGKSVNQIKSDIKLNSRHYAKKQYTFMNGIPNAKIFQADDLQAIQKEILDFTQQKLEL